MAIAGCGPSVRPAGPGRVPFEEPRDAASGQRPVAGAPLLLGEMCPQGVAGRAGIAPVVARGVSWTDDGDELTALLERGAVARFVALGHDGARAGTFDLAEVVEVGAAEPVGAGVYVGTAPCTHAVGTDARAEDPSCNVAARGCGLALAEIDAPVPDREPVLAEAAIGGACVAGADLAVDLDGDGAVERFRIGNLLDAGRVPAEVISAEPPAAAACTPQFSIFGLTLAPGFEAGARVDPKYVVDLDVLGVLDLDGDGRRELVLAVRYPTARSLVVYSPRESVERLERVGEARTWP
ncbi:MAG: hypothetical protein R2939_04915 [Kofleriaceae bacterium]